MGRVDVDGSRYLLGDEVGGLHMLVLVHDGEKVVGLKLEALGHTSAPSTISYLDSGVVFVVSVLPTSLVSHHSTRKHPLQVEPLGVLVV